LEKLALPKNPAKVARRPAGPAKVAPRTAGKAAAAPVAEAPVTKPQPISDKKSPRPKKIRKEEIIFSVTQAFRKKFKQAAKESGYKKSDFLQILFLHWEEGQQKRPSGASL